MASGERILAGARDLFKDRLYDQVSLEDVAGRAGVTVRTVVRRFGSKEQLFAMVAAERARDIRSKRAQTVAGDVLGAVRTLVETHEMRGDEVLHLLAQEPRTQAISERVQSGREFHQGWVNRVFSPLLVELPAAERRRKLAQLTAVMDVYVWKVLRRDLGLSRREVEGSLTDLIYKIVDRRPNSPRLPR